MSDKNKSSIRLIGETTPMTKAEYLDRVRHKIDYDSNMDINGYLFESNGVTMFIEDKLFEQDGNTQNLILPLTKRNTITQEIVDDFIVKIDTQTYGERTTVVNATLKNGFIITEASSSIDAKNYDENIGRDICVDKIKDKVWELLGFMCK